MHILNEKLIIEKWNEISKVTHTNSKIISIKVKHRIRIQTSNQIKRNRSEMTVQTEYVYRVVIK